MTRGAGSLSSPSKGTNTNTRSSLDTHHIPSTSWPCMHTCNATYTRPGPSSDIPAVLSALTYITSCKSKAEEARTGIPWHHGSATALFYAQLLVSQVTIQDGKPMSSRSTQTPRKTRNYTSDNCRTASGGLGQTVLELQACATWLNSTHRLLTTRCHLQGGWDRRAPPRHRVSSTRACHGIRAVRCGMCFRREEVFYLMWMLPGLETQRNCTTDQMAGTRWDVEDEQTSSHLQAPRCELLLRPRGKSTVPCIPPIPRRTHAHTQTRTVAHKVAMHHVFSKSQGR